EYIMLLTFLGYPGTHPKIQALARYLLKKRQADGGWPIYEGGPSEVNNTIKGYLSLKIAGQPPDEPEMQKTRALALELGGIDGCNSFTKLYLAMLGQMPWDCCPCVPPELILAPDWFYVNIYAMSSWSRTIVVPLSVIFATKPTVQLPEAVSIGYLFKHGKPRQLPWDERLVSWKNFWLVVNKLLWVHEKSPLKPFRQQAVKKALQWTIERTRNSEGLGAIFPPIVNTVVALRSLGYPMDDPHVREAMRQLEMLEIWEGDVLRMQPCKSPVWDTAIANIALLESGLEPDHPALIQATRWLLDREVRHVGDWVHANPNGKPGGWYFEYANEPYPDLDDTCYVLLGLSKIQYPDAGRQRGAIRRGLDWLLSMQNDDGSWASFDKNNNRTALEKMPFADHNAMIDPGTSDITARILEMLAAYGYDQTSPCVRRALEFLRRDQQPDGSWFGRWGTNYLYGTWQVLKGLRCIGVDPRSEMVQAGARWLLSVQNPDGGWGETCASYDDPSRKGKGPSTASQTSWALMGLISAGLQDSESAQRGLRYLLDNQTPQGTWDEPWFTGTGFPRVYYLRYHYYRHYFPLFALGMYLRATESHQVVSLGARKRA
ncbi:MAG: squalene--hopene cyclase, partial [Candidatus Eremiobacterota bacterium]